MPPGVKPNIVIKTESASVICEPFSKFMLINLIGLFGLG